MCTEFAQQQLYNENKGAMGGLKARSLLAKAYGIEPAGALRGQLGKQMGSVKVGGASVADAFKEHDFRDLSTFMPWF